MSYHSLLLLCWNIMIAVTAAHGELRIQDLQISASDGSGADRFGSTIAVSNGVAVVGHNQDDDYGDDTGSAYLFDTFTGTQTAKLLSSDAAAGDHFGEAVSITGNKVLIGESWDDDNGGLSGSAYIFDAHAGSQLRKLTPTVGMAGEFFGSAVGIAGNVAIVGAHGNKDNGTYAGAAYLFDVTTGQQLFKIKPDDGAALDNFGERIAITDGMAIVGAPSDDDNGPLSR